MAVQTDINGGVSGNSERAGHGAVLHQVVVPGALDVVERIDGGISGKAVGMGGQLGHKVVVAARHSQGLRLEGEAAVVILNIPAHIGDDHGALCLLNALQGQRNGDVAARLGSLLRNELLCAGEIEVFKNGLGGGVIPNGDGAGAQVYGALGIQIDAAALVVGGVVLNGAAAEVQGAAYIDAAALDGLQTVVILHRHGVGLDGGIVVHGEGAALTDIDAAALGIAVGVAGAGQVAAYAGIARHGELAGSAHKHAAALVLRRVIVPPSGVIRDLGVAGHGEGAVIHGHAAAVASGSVAGNFAAGHFEYAASADIHAAAVTLDIIAHTGPVVLDNAAGHFEYAAVYIHGAAVKGAAGPFIVGRTVAGDLTAHEDEGAGGVHQHAADIIAFGADPTGALVILDGAAIHIKCTVGLHSTRLEPGLIGIEGVVADAAVIEVEGGSGADDNAAGIGDIALAIDDAGDLAVGAAVGEVKPKPP